MAASKGELRFECAAKERTFEYSKLSLSPNIHCSVALIHKFADISIHRYLFPNTADTDVFYIIIIKQRLMNQQVKMKI